MSKKPALKFPRKCYMGKRQQLNEKPHSDENSAAFSSGAPTSEASSSGSPLSEASSSGASKSEASSSGASKSEASSSGASKSEASSSGASKSEASSSGASKSEASSSGASSSEASSSLASCSKIRADPQVSLWRSLNEKPVKKLQEAPEPDDELDNCPSPIVEANQEKLKQDAESEDSVFEMEDSESEEYGDSDNEINYCYHMKIRSRPLSRPPTPIPDSEQIVKPPGSSILREPLKVGERPTEYDQKFIFLKYLYRKANKPRMYPQYLKPAKKRKADSSSESSQEESESE